jgi:hypothetical protein
MRAIVCSDDPFKSARRQERQLDAAATVLNGAMGREKIFYLNRP